MRIAGVPGTPVRTRHGWNSQQGFFTEYDFEGNESYIQSVFAIYAQPGQNVLEVDHQNDGSFYVLRARVATNDTSGDPEAPVLTIRSQVNRIDKDIFEPPWRGAVTEENVRVIRKFLLDPPENASPPFTSPNQDTFDLYNLAAAGVRTRQVNQVVLAVTRSAPRDHAWGDNTGWVGYNMGHAQMIANAGIAGALNFTLPVIDAPVSLAVDVGSSPLLFYYGWVKQEPFYDTSTGDRSVEYLSYEFGLWPVYLFPLATF